jgi:hypothetical protein
MYQWNALHKQRHVRTLAASLKENKFLHQSELKPTGIWILYIQFFIAGQLYITVVTEHGYIALELKRREGKKQIRYN